MSKITSGDILKLLSEKHSEDVFVPECKDGSTWFGQHFRLDAWVMNRSWTKLKFTGYEIKVSRSDFLKDDKHQEYMKLCNEFYFVVPKGICSIDEIPPEAGLLEIASTGNRLFTRKKAMFRKIEFPSDLFTYLLMCRTKISRRYNPISDKQYWEMWLNDKNENKTLGRSVSQKLKKSYEENFQKVRDENYVLRNKIQEYEEFKKLLLEIGVTDSDSYYKARDKIRVLKESEIIENLESSLNFAKRNIENTIENLQRFK
jgi:hypothetical protein